MQFFIYLFILLIGLSAGSFVTALSYRLPRGISIFKKTRSFCDKCDKKLKWYENIPFFSYILIKGKCVGCNKRISLRYPIIETATAFLFVATWATYQNCSIFGSGMALCGLSDNLGILSVPIFWFVITILITLLVIDYEHQILPDSLIFLLLVPLLIYVFVFSPSYYVDMLSGLSASLFLLFLFFITLGKGMGLGDVKFALFGGILLGWPYVLVWMFLSFLVGAVVGVLLIALKKARFGKPIAFGPFLIASLIFVLFWGDKLILFLPLPFI